MISIKNNYIKLDTNNTSYIMHVGKTGHLLNLYYGRKIEIVNDDISFLDEKVVYPHSFRHRYAKNFLEKYSDIALLADLMGHESIETTRIYLRRTASEQQEIVDTVVTW